MAPFNGTESQNNGAPKSGARIFWTTFALGALMTPFSFLAAHLLSVKLFSFLHVDLRQIAVGAAATAPLVLMLIWFMASTWRPIARFRASQLKFFHEIGFPLTPARCLLLSIVAGVGEELLFRGVLQGAAVERWPLFAAIVAPNMLFGALHARNLVYAVAAAGVGIYLGVLFWLTGNLIAPIVAHGLYDFIALEWARRILVRATANPSGQ